MQQSIYIYLEHEQKSVFVGQLWSRSRKGKESATFEYTKEWLSSDEAFALEPALQLIDGPQHTSAGKTLFGALGDSAPDRWGRVLMRRAERKRAVRSQQTPRTLLEIDYLLGVNDFARQGALRFAQQQGGSFLSNTEASIPPLMALPKLLSATERLAEDKDTAADLKLLLAPGSSLGGARPKASVLAQDGALLIAKFPHHQDEYQTVLWEALALQLAKEAGVITSDAHIKQVAKKAVLLLRRFDRDGDSRIPYLSAMSMLSANDNEQRSYLEIADIIKQHSNQPQENLAQLWRRIVFNVMISNTDDHLRNHGFLYSNARGWYLSPAFDLNPVPIDIKPRMLSTMIDLDDSTASLDLALSVIEYFNLSWADAKNIVADIVKSVSRWRSEAKKFGLKVSEIERMASAFEHNDLKRAQEL